MKAKHPLMSARRLNIDFDQYTDGDESFKFELATLIRENLKALQTDLLNTIATNRVNPFLEQCHKVYPTIAMLNDVDLSSAVTSLQSHFKGTDTLTGSHLGRIINTFQVLTDALITSLSFIAVAA